MAIQIFGRPENPRTRAVLAVAKHENVQVEVHGTEHPTFKEKFPLAKIPALVDGDYAVSETLAIAVYLASVNRSASTTSSLAETAKNVVGLGPITLLGSTLHERASILQWSSFANQELLPQQSEWYLPLIGKAQYNKKNVDEAESKTKQLFAILNDHLINHTFLVTERVSLADVILASIVQRGNEFVFGKAFRANYPAVFRHFNTVFRQSFYSEVVGQKEPSFIDEAVKYSPPAKQPKAEPKKAEPKAAAAAPKQQEEQAAPPPKPKHPLEALGPATCFPIDEVKRQFSNLETPDFLKWFAEKYNPQEYSLWQLKYQYNDELTMVFMSSNLVTGLHTRLEGSRKYIFGNMGIYGKNNDNAIRGVYLVRGGDAKPAFEVAPDIESYEITPLNWEKEEDRKLVERVWLWEDEFEGKQWADGKIFK